jgi:hypothetical protein
MEDKLAGLFFLFVLVMIAFIFNMSLLVVGAWLGMG